ncbi:MAG: hypothetical protein ACL93V_08595 [Candidatus Electrothrix sp. YB6]
MKKLKPSLFGWKFLFEHRIVMRVTGESSAEKKYRFVKDRHYGVSDGMSFFYRCNVRVARHRLLDAFTRFLKRNKSVITRILKEKQS